MKDGLFRFIVSLMSDAWQTSRFSRCSAFKESSSRVKTSRSFSGEWTSLAGTTVRYDVAVKAIRKDPELATAANVLAGKVTHEGVARSFNLPFVEPARAL